MIHNLSIRNYILIQNIEVDLTSKFNVFTGETGSGKSMLIDAINFGMGQRSSSSVIGKHGDSARVEIIMSLPNSYENNQKFEDLDITQEEDGTVILTREIFKDGRNVSRINGRIVTLSTVKSFISGIIDIHSQHETQALLDSSQHLSILDKFSQNDQILNDYKAAYSEYRKLENALKEFKTSNISPEVVREAKKNLESIELFQPGVQDYEDTNQKLEELANYERNQNIYDSILNFFKRDDEVLSKMYDLIQNFEQLDKDEILNQYKDAYFNIEDVCDTVSKLSSKSNFDLHEFERLQERAYQYQKLIKKYGSLDELLEVQNQYRNLISQADNYDDLLIDHENALLQSEELLKKASMRLSESRKVASKQLIRLVETQLNDLLLENAKFDVSFGAKEYSTNGNDTVQFMVSMNKGESLQALDKVASGGELSRLMLGLKVIFSRVLNLKTLVFDEIDTGVSGRAGFQIGAKMREISKEVQVITISHLSSVAACAHAHYAISKSQDDFQTFTALNKVDGEARVNELALIMSGSTSESSREAAKELLKEGQAL